MSGSMDMPGMAARTGFALLLAMWSVMMVAMMIPAASPTILLFARAARQHGTSPPVAAFVAGYLAVWGLFALAAAGLQAGLQATLLLSPERMSLTGRILPATVLVAAGLYQFSQMKSACLGHCRHPATFLARHYRPGARGAFGMGFRHGGFCLGCCWALMLLLFVGGVMNSLWIVGLALLVAAEKLLPAGRWIGRFSGALLLCAGAAMLA